MTSTASAPTCAAFLISLMVLMVLCCPAPAIRTESVAARDTSITSRYSRSSRCTRSPVEPRTTKPITPRARQDLMCEVMSVVEIWPSGANGVVVGSRIPFRLSIDVIMFRQDDRIYRISKMSMEQISDSDREEDIPAAFARALVHVPCVAEREMCGRGEFEANARARTVTRATKRAIARADPRHVEHEHRADRIDVHIVKERVESATRERHVVRRLLLRARFVDLFELGRHRYSQCLNAARGSADVRISQRGIQLGFA